jgi:polar amino acid transport system substrate-binding protein
LTTALLKANSSRANIIMEILTTFRKRTVQMYKVIVFISYLLANNFAYAEHINVYTNNEPFLSYYDTKTGEQTGLAIDVIKLLLNDVGHKSTINIYPLTRIKKRHLEDKNNLFVLLYKNIDSLKNYQKVGTITKFPVNIYKLKTRSDITINSLNDFKHYSIGVVRNGSRHNYLIAEGFSDNLKNQIVTSDRQNIYRFFIGRFDLLIENPIVLKYFAMIEKQDLTLVEKLLPLEDLSGDMGLFFSASTDKKLVIKYQKALNKIKKTDIYKNLLKKYGATL